MMQTAADLAKVSLIPGSVWFLLMGLITGLLLVAAPRPLNRAAVPLLTTLALLYCLLSLPAVADGLATGFGVLPRRPATVEELSGTHAIVVLGAGASSYQAAGRQVTVPLQQTVFNAWEGARLFRLLNGRVDVIASGGIVDPQPTASEPEAVVVRDLLQGSGVPIARIILEIQSRTTHAQAQHVSALLKARRWHRVALVTSPAHLMRAIGSFAAEGVSPIPAPAPFRSEEPGGSSSRWKPSSAALGQSELSMYDYSAWLYYRTRGWLTPH